MKTIIKISVLLNAVLLGTALFLWVRPRTIRVPAPATPVVTAAAEPQTPTPPAPPVAQTVVAPFNWNQLVSTNGYRTFVANLRAAGCPESTVEDIVRGNVQRAFDWKRRELHVDGSEPGPWSAQAQAQMVAYFLGQAANSGEAAEIAEGSPAVAPLERPVNPMLVPIEDIDPAALAALNLNDDQKQVIAEVQRTYSAALSGQKQTAANASPSSSSSQSSQEQAGDTPQNAQSPASTASSQPAQTGASTAQQQAQAEANANAALEAALGSDGYLGYRLAQEQTALENQLKAHPGWVSGNPQ